MADLTIDLDFKPVNLDGDFILHETLAKAVGKLLCEGNGTGSADIKYQVGKTLYNTGLFTFTNIESEETKGLIAYFKTMCNEYPEWDNQIKGQILEKFI